MLLVALSLSCVVSNAFAAETEDIFAKFQQSDYKVDFEWGEVVRYNKQKVNHFQGIVFKYNRTTTAINGTVENNFDVGNGFELVIQAYKFASNEFRLFPLRFQVGFCFALSKNLGGGQSTYKCGNFTGCPFRKGVRYHMCNTLIDPSRFPPFIPNGRYMLEFQGTYNDAELFLLRGYESVSRPIKWQ